MEETGKVRKKRDTSQKRKAILEGAVKVFTKEGFDASSMDHIAEVAGVSKRTVYNHFPSKEILFQAIVADFLKQRDATLGELATRMRAANPVPDEGAFIFADASNRLRQAGWSNEDAGTPFRAFSM